eukprot:TRINITY_DN9437_c0_g1_i1.p1 TRINITY_DN9437_c0_g1~~TRINITY_DN9437_c0_g1_i1.p1  ORF type:complete len:375 (-),score=44.61 TRINITY_DN9437_c0_g1_i1:11-1135(-)
MSKKKIVISSYKDLPLDIKSLVMKSGIKKKHASQHLSVLVNALRFKTKRRISVAGEERDPSYKRVHSGHSSVSEEICSVADFDHEEAELLDPRYKKRHFKNLRHLGKGGYGAVYLGTTRTKKKVAIKQLSHDTKTGSKYIRRNYQEIRFLRYCVGQSCIVQFERAIKVDSKLWIITEYLDGKDLGSCNFGLEEPDIAYIIRKILKGLSFLHNSQIAHRDIKSSNIMLTLEGKVKIIDFGLCTDISQGPLVTMVGSPHYMAPEMIRQEPHGLPVDIWAVGIIAIILANGSLPHKNQLKALFMAGSFGIIKPLKYPQNHSPEFVEFVTQSLQFNQFDRPSCDELLEYPFFNLRSEKSKMIKLFEGFVISSQINFAL